MILIGDDGQEFRIAVNAERQYSIRSLGRVNAPGRSDEGTHGTRDECLTHVQRVWTDMCPLGARDDRGEPAS
ncbi:MbtH family NRPS accessory protein [Streptomyces sp. NPDC093249]|uniref:MbtH family NRPS accessory protein n=1 Tax=unclassified Streptomyces TaxID=2593676 RepID=UPI00344B7344